MQKQYHQEVLAAEMEGSGFARACREHAVPWLVFRGISDFGDANKSKLGDWKATAALSAATAVVAFLKKDYRQDLF
jgi:nucleoside phosphorylase